MPYAADALQPLSLVSLAPNILIVKADSPFKDVKDLVARAKAQPGKLNFASGGSGTVQRLASELFRQKLDLDMVHVRLQERRPGHRRRDGRPGRLHVQHRGRVLSAGGRGQAARAGRSRRRKRSQRLPDVPTVAETAIPGYEVYEWNGMLAAGGHAAPVAGQAAQGAGRGAEGEDVKQRFDRPGRAAGRLHARASSRPS